MAAQAEDPNAPTPTNAFFYGTLMSPAVLTRVTGRPPANFVARSALLQNHRRHRVKYADYPAIIPTEGSTVRGTYVTGLNESDVRRLDVFEGDQYLRRNVKIRLLKQAGAVGGKGASTKSGGAETQVLPPATKVGVNGPDASEPTEADLEAGEVTTATYIWNDDRFALEEEEWDFGEFVREKLWRWAGSRADEEGEYAEVDQAVREDEAPDYAKYVKENMWRKDGEDANVGEEHDPTGGRAFGGKFEKSVNGQP